MAILAFQKPDKVVMLESTDKYGKFEFRPLEPGYGITIGNALRRILLSSLEGYAITSVKINGVNHEFATIAGIMEDVTEIILNLKQIRFRQELDDSDVEDVSIRISGQDKFTAGDINKFMSNFRVLNPELVICRMEPDVKLQLDLLISKGRGYVPSAENVPADKEKAAEFGRISIDSIFTPIKNVKYSVENFRVEQKTDYERLIIEITTDGSIHPKEALKEAAKVLILHFMLFSDEKITIEQEEKFSNEEYDEELVHMRQLLKTRLIDMDLSVRALNCLKAAEVETMGELVTFNRNDLLKFRNFGKKSLNELDELLTQMHLTFGMDITKYKIDKD
ncbi:MAG: DNA-directed RNA polymerase subunit alpha [Bacteroidales bacterium]|jgi:DNA-directed RNA polymerase subunit alpha|nr:DNA-directed RNA polymerase subunit alpha [Bacteroidales bacterium]